MRLLELKNVSYRYGDGEQEVLNGVNACFESGRVYAVMGKPGSGKTTLLSLLAGLDVSSGGEIQYLGRSLNAIDRDEYRARCIGTVFQSCNLIANTTAVENVALSLGIGGERAKDRKEKAYALLREAGVGRDAADQKVSRLSAAQRKRAAIARALAHDPGILLADEPTCDLGAEEETEILGMLAELARKHDKCLILATGSKKAASAADELWALAGGRMLFVR